MSDSKNGGIGLVSQRLSATLSQKVALTVIQSENVNIDDHGISTSSVSDASLVQAITKKVETQVYVYDDLAETKEQEKTSEAKKELQVFTEGVVAQSKGLDADIIYAHDWVSFEAALKIKEETKKPLILHVHSLDVDRISSINHSWVFDVEKRAFEQADMIIAVSNYTAERVAQFYGVDQKKIQVIYNGVDLPDTVDYAEKFDEPTVLFVGRLSGQKGPQNFIEIATKVLTEKAEVKFIMAGDGEMKEDLIETVAHKKIGDQIYFPGHLPKHDLEKLFSEATVFCLPSISEPFGLAVMEAAAAQVPVIISKQSGAAELLPHAITIDKADTDSFAEAILEVIDQEIISEEMIDQNQKVTQELTWEKTTDQILNLFNSFT